MNSRVLSGRVVAVALASVALAGGVQNLEAQDANCSFPAVYEIAELTGLGGPLTRVYGLNDAGLAVAVRVYVRARR